jgi:hypothetical protein
LWGRGKGEECAFQKVENLKKRKNGRENFSEKLRKIKIEEI